MVKMVEVSPEDIPTERLGRRGRVSYPMLKSFLEANVRCVKLDTTGYVKNPAYLRSVLYSYIKSHKLPIKLFSAGGEMYLLRLDMTKDGSLIEDWKPDEDVATEGAGGLLRDMAAQSITPEEVNARFEVEKRVTTK